MKSKQSCIQRFSSCDNCELRALFMRNPLSKMDLQYHRNCLTASINYAEYLCRELAIAPSGKRDADAVKLLELAGTSLARHNYMIVLKLCEAAMDSIISRGMKSTVDRRRAFVLMGHYRGFLNDFEEYSTDENEFFDAYAAYLNERFQIMHLMKDYSNVVKEYNNHFPRFSGSSGLQREVRAHFSASAYLTNVKKNIITSRDVAEHLYENVRDRYVIEQNLSAGDYYILAKFLEHYIQENNILRGLDIISPFSDVILSDEVESSKKAINKAIFHRDMFEALAKVESDECIIHYNIAQQIIDDYGIADQQSKLIQKKKEVTWHRGGRLFAFSGVDAQWDLEEENHDAFASESRCGEENEDIWTGRKKFPVTDIFSEEQLCHNIWQALINVQKNGIYKGGLENVINDGVRDNLAMIYPIRDQTRQGESESGQSAGEVDLLIDNSQNLPYVLIEALRLRSVDSENLCIHIEKALCKYDPIGCPFVFVLAYVTNSNFDAFWKKYFDYLCEYEFPYTVVKPVAEINRTYTESRHARVVLERSGKEVCVHFLALNLK